MEDYLQKIFETFTPEQKENFEKIINNEEFVKLKEEIRKTTEESHI